MLSESSRLVSAGARLAATLCCFVIVTRSVAQQPSVNALQPGLSPQAANQASSAAGQNDGPFSGSQGGSAQADFDSLIDLIESTVAQETWAENGTGEGEISPFAINGVYADPAGTLRFALPRAKLVSNAVARKINAVARTPSAAAESLSAATQTLSTTRDRDVRETSPLRFVSLPRLEGAIRRRQAQHQPLSPEMLTLAGLQRIEYVLVVPSTGDLIFAGPAGDWQVRPDGILVSTESGHPVVRLDDLLTLWRRQPADNRPAFGCSIIPRQEALAATQKFLQSSNSQPLEPGKRGKWLQALRTRLGEQDVAFFGLAPSSHVAKVLLVADYHMKLIGMGLAEGVDGVTDYLTTLEIGPDGNRPPMSVLRWWFAMKYEPVETTTARDAFHLQGQGVQVLSENEILAARGERVHTGQSDELNKRFASSFTAQFEQIEQRYPLYGELRNVFDIALVLSLIQQEGLLEQIGWQADLFLDSHKLRLPQIAVPQVVETVINHRVLRRKHIVAGISGGVWVDGRQNLGVKTSANGITAKVKQKLVPEVDRENEVWWWD